MRSGRWRRVGGGPKGESRPDMQVGVVVVEGWGGRVICGMRRRRPGAVETLLLVLKVKRCAFGMEEDGLIICKTIHVQIYSNATLLWTNVVPAPPNANGSSSLPSESAHHGMQQLTAALG
eukprot:6180426-Pleurochrysis_carterae.AAC.2